MSNLHLPAVMVSDDVIRLRIWTMHRIHLDGKLSSIYMLFGDRNHPKKKKCVLWDFCITVEHFSCSCPPNSEFLPVYNFLLQEAVLGRQSAIRTNKRIIIAPQGWAWQGTLNGLASKAGSSVPAFSLAALPSPPASCHPIWIWDAFLSR